MPASGTRSAFRIRAVWIVRLLRSGGFQHACRAVNSRAWSAVDDPDSQLAEAFSSGSRSSLAHRGGSASPQFCSRCRVEISPLQAASADPGASLSTSRIVTNACRIAQFRLSRRLCFMKPARSIRCKTSRLADATSASLCSLRPWNRVSILSLPEQPCPADYADAVPTTAEFFAPA